MKLAPKTTLKDSKSQKYAILAENGLKMTILNPFQSSKIHGYEILTNQNWHKESLVIRPLGVGYEISTKNHIEGLIIAKYAISAEIRPKMTILDPFRSSQVHGIEISTDQIGFKSLY